jgi:hypothetical protein
MMLSNVTGTIEEMNRRAHALKIQEADQTSKGITIRRFIDKRESPQCQIDMPTVTEHLRRTCRKMTRDNESSDHSGDHLSGDQVEE